VCREPLFIRGVRRPDNRLVQELYTARCAAEPEAVRLDALRLGAAPLTAARQALQEATVLVGSGETRGLGVANRRFHRELYSACDNSFLPWRSATTAGGGC